MIKTNKDNPNIKNAVNVKGCPPLENDVVAAFKSVGLDVNISAYHGFMKQQSGKYEDKEGYDKRFFSA
jgi:hypothetical protein